jgi:NAD(P)H-hydrate repair Nnr-like enzyme with NAD(P)H-hydrate epimerase domain
VSDYADNARRGKAAGADSAGPGNNGGDGYVAARFFSGEDSPWLYTLRSRNPGTIPRLLLSTDGPILPWEVPSVPRLLQTALMIDALLGTGSRPTERGGSEAVETFLPGRCPVLAVDSPTGVNGLTGEADPQRGEGGCHRYLAAPKLGHLLPPGCGCTGAVFWRYRDPGCRKYLREVMDMPERGNACRTVLSTPQGILRESAGFGRLRADAGSRASFGLGAIRSEPAWWSCAFRFPLRRWWEDGFRKPYAATSCPGDITRCPILRSPRRGVGPGMGNDQAVKRWFAMWWRSA